ncbi:MAG: helix-turn-helix transcriptional regulator [Ruminococcaceae bacterium]|nr:helix-turn-helix transcriptional regulator [Oscillospiraceae bacterium]
MPKIIENLEEKILTSAEKLLFEKGYQSMTMRGVAEDCGIAVGTVYNYYKSKDMLVAKIMLKDWITIIKDIEHKCSSALDIHEGFKIMYDGVSFFVEKYNVVWTQYGKEINVRKEMPVYFELLIAQLSEILNEILVRCYNETDEYVSIFLSEILLNAATKKEFEYENLSRILFRMFKSNE